VNENHEFFPDVTPKILSSKPKRTPVTKAEIAAYQGIYRLPEDKVVEGTMWIS
jgi:hypothetical protein